MEIRGFFTHLCLSFPLVVGVSPCSQQISTRQPLSHPSLSSSVEEGGEKDQRGSSWVEMKAV